MAKQVINIGSSANDKSGDPLRTAFTKVNDNFTELYARAENTDSQTLSLDGDTLSISGGNSVTLPSSSGITASSEDTLTNKTLNIAISEGNTFQIQGNSITSYSGSGSVVALTDLPTLNGINVNNSSLTIDGGTGNYYWKPTAFDGTGTIHKAGIYKSNSDANNSLFTLGANGAGVMSVAVEGSVFIGNTLPSNSGGLNTNYGGWLVVQSGGKFGGDVNTLGKFILDSAENGGIVFGDGSTQTTAWDTGYLSFDKSAVRGTSDYQYTFNTDGYFTSSVDTESANYFFVPYNSTNLNIAAGWTVVGANCDTTVSSTTYPVAGYPGVIKVNLSAPASSNFEFYPVTVTSPNRLKVQIQPNPSNSSVQWLFNSNGDLQLPAGGDIVDSTGTSVLGGGGGTGALDLQTVPATNKGQAGDTKGMVAINGSEFYFCAENYTDGVNPIWFKLNGSSAW